STPPRPHQQVPYSPACPPPSTAALRRLTIREPTPATRRPTGRPLRGLRSAVLPPAAPHPTRVDQRRHQVVPLPRPRPTPLAGVVDVGSPDRARHRLAPDHRLPLADGPVVLDVRTSRRPGLGGPTPVVGHAPVRRGNRRGVPAAEARVDRC